MKPKVLDFIIKNINDKSYFDNFDPLLLFFFVKMYNIYQIYFLLFSHFNYINFLISVFPILKKLYQDCLILPPLPLIIEVFLQNVE